MEMMGFSPNEIDQDCKIRPPTNIDEELREYNAMLAITETPVTVGSGEYIAESLSWTQIESPTIVPDTWTNWTAELGDTVC
jgi:hypothetical protein